MKLNILFVDDEKNVINGLKRMLRVLKEDWEFFFAEGGDEALKIMSNVEIHVLVSDMRMPKMNGAELLSIVKEKYPSTIRIILSGQSNEDLALQSTQTAHRFIAKPINGNELKTTIQNSLKLHSFLKDKKLRRIINGINQLPTLPETYLKIDREVSKENISLQKIAEIISGDVILSAKFLQIVNSAFFGLPQNISSIHQAVNLIGADTIKSLVMYIQVFKQVSNNKKLDDLLKSIWAHSLSVAKCAKNLSSKIGKNSDIQETAYMAGLLHDIGKIVILSNTTFCQSIINKIENEKTDYNSAELNTLGIDHTTVGAYLLSLWGLPETVVHAIQQHHNFEIFNRDELKESDILFLANLAKTNKAQYIEFINQNNLSELADICNE